MHSAGNPTFNERAKLDAVLRRHPRLNSPPGTRFAYSNIGYMGPGLALAVLGVALIALD